MVVRLNVSSVLPVLVSTIEPNTDSPGAAEDFVDQHIEFAPATHRLDGDVDGIAHRFVGGRDAAQRVDHAVVRRPRGNFTTVMATCCVSPAPSWKVVGDTVNSNQFPVLSVVHSTMNISAAVPTLTTSTLIVDAESGLANIRVLNAVHHDFLLDRRRPHQSCSQR